MKKSGETVIVNIGEEEDDPVFFISDLLPHLAQDQMKKNASAFIEGEALDLVIGNKPVIIDHDTKAGSKDKKPSEKDAVTKALMQTISELYGIEEEDFYSAEIEAVPAGKARDFGLDRSMIMGYGHDDRVCAFAELKAVLLRPKPASVFLK